MTFLNIVYIILNLNLNSNFNCFTDNGSGEGPSALFTSLINTFASSQTIRQVDFTVVEQFCWQVDSTVRKLTGQQAGTSAS